MAAVRGRLAEALIRSSEGRVLHVEFLKRSTGQFRIMRCAYGRHAGPIGGGPRRYNPEDHGLIVVFDLDRNDWRCIPLESILSVVVEGRE
jgi:hypothetical protein